MGGLLDIHAKFHKYFILIIINWLNNYEKVYVFIADLKLDPSFFFP